MGQGIVPEQDVVIAFSMKELFVEIRDDLKAINGKLDEKASREDVEKINARLDKHDEEIADNKTRWASLRAYMIGAAAGSGLVSGGIVAGILKLVNG